MKNLEPHAKIFGALSHPTRLLFMERLSEGEKSRLELQYGIAASEVQVNKHLTTLKQARLIQSRVEGNKFYWHLSGGGIAQIIEAAQEVLGPRPSHEKLARFFESLSYSNSLALIQALAEKPRTMPEIREILKRLGRKNLETKALEGANIIRVDRPGSHDALRSLANPNIIKVIEAAGNLVQKSKK